MMNGHNIVYMAKTLERSTGEIGAADFKARCLELVNHVHEAHAEYVVTRHGEPMARLVPIEREVKTGLFGVMRGTVLHFDDPYAPVPGTWALASGPDGESA